MTVLIARKTLEETLQGNEEHVVVRPDFKNMIGGDCVSFTCYALGVPGDCGGWLKDTLPKCKLKEGETPKKGDVIVYFNSARDREAFNKKSKRSFIHSNPKVNHYGIYLGDGKVISKWGGWDVVEHSWDLSIYGTDVDYYRVDDEDSKEFIAKYGNSQSFKDRFHQMVFGNDSN